MNVRIALAGNPNCGKTTLFNALTGSNQFVGNWPGVTVEKKEGKLKKHDGVVITDLPGIYSLSPYWKKLLQEIILSAKDLTQYLILQTVQTLKETYILQLSLQNWVFRLLSQSI